MRETAGSFICICHCQLRGRGGRDHFQDPLPFIPLIPLLRLFRHPSLPPRDEFRRDAIVSPNDRGYRGKLIHWSILSIFFFFFPFRFINYESRLVTLFARTINGKLILSRKSKDLDFCFSKRSRILFFPPVFFLFFFFLFTSDRR